MGSRIVWFIIGIVATIVGAIVVEQIVMRTGAYNVAATQPHLPIVRRQLAGIMDHSVETRAKDIQIPAGWDDAASVEHGAHEYVEMCEVCHGAPGVDRSHIGEGLYPKPPNLAHSADEFSPAELFWIAKHGVKDTGMPAFSESHDDATIWDMVAFMKKLPDMTPEEYHQWRVRVGPPPGVPGEMPVGQGAEQGEADSTATRPGS